MTSRHLSSQRPPYREKGKGAGAGQVQMEVSLKDALPLRFTSLRPPLPGVQPRPARFRLAEPRRPEPKQPKPAPSRSRVPPISCLIGFTHPTPFCSASIGSLRSRALSSLNSRRSLCSDNFHSFWLGSLGWSFFSPENPQALLPWLLLVYSSTLWAGLPNLHLWI